jgi:hypothetical protein
VTHRPGCAPWSRDALLGPSLQDLLVDPVGNPHQGQLPQGGQVVDGEVPLQGQLGLGRVGVDVAVHHPSPQRVRRHVHQLHLVGEVQHPVRDGLLLADAGDAGDQVVEADQVLDVDGGDDRDALCQDVQHVLPALGPPAAGDVGVGQLVDQRPFRVSRDQRFGIQLLEGPALVGEDAGWDDLEALEHSIVWGRP